MQNTTITVDLGGQQEKFTCSDLKRIPYFQALLSDRWAKDAIIKPFENQNESLCNCDDLKLLIKCVVEGSIPTNTNPQCDILEGLIACSEYFTNNVTSIVNEETLIKYFTNAKPAITYQQRLNLAQHTKNDLLKKTIHNYNVHLNTQLQEARSKWVLQIKQNGSDSTINYDKKTRVQLFEQSFELLFKQSKRGIHISINNTDIVSIDNCNLWCESTPAIKDSTLIHHIIYLMQMVEWAVTQNRELLITDMVTKSIIEKILAHITDQLRNNNNPNWSTIQKKYNSVDMSLLSFCKTQFRFIMWTTRKDDDLPNFKMFFHESINCMSKKDNGNFVSSIVELYPNYYNYYRQSNSYGLQCWKTHLQSYRQLIKQCLMRCNIDDVLAQAKQWFHILKNEKCDEGEQFWVLKRLIEPQSTNTCFRFGLFLSNQIVFEHDNTSKDSIPQSYWDFVYVHLGIQWELIPQSIGNHKS